MIKKLVSFASLFTFVSACSDDMSISDYDYGYGDGNAVGYNIVCNHANQPIKADWGNEKYAEGYAHGVVEGVIEGMKKCKPGMR